MGQLRIGAFLYPERIRRPATRAECAQGVRPCPYVSCSQHLYLDVTKAGNVKINFPDLEPWELTWSCALDVADAVQLSGYSLTMETTGRLVNLSPERVRQIEEVALERANTELRRLLGRELEEIAPGHDARRNRHEKDDT